jgi:hypothetical protein
MSTDLYFFNTVKYCGGVEVDENGNVVTENTAPCYKWAGKKNMSYLALKNYYFDKGIFINSTKVIHELKESD